MRSKNPTEHRALELVSTIAANEDAFPSGKVPAAQQERIPAGWNPYDVWRTRVKAPQDAKAARRDV
jgi:hypothetical protein